ncbi:MAG: hypothetical protein WAN13_07785 [Candidatus Acidiferrales bacterium]
MKRLRTCAVCLLAALGAIGSILVLSGTAKGEHTRFWRQTDYSDFEKGTRKGVALRSDGWLAPAPHFAQFADPNLAYLWQVRLDSHGHVFAAGGSNAKVVRFDESGKATTVFESQELSAQTILFDSKDNLYVGTSPDGKVYKVTPDGQKSVFFEPKTKYIWALALDSHGTLFVGTGDKGEVFAVGPDGKGLLFYKTDERHARSLALDAKGNLLVGTDPDGLILRVDVSAKKGAGTPEAGHAFVLYETDKKEVTALLDDAHGNIYAAAIGEKPKTVPFVPPPVIVQAPPQAQVSAGGQVTIEAQVPITAAAPIPFFPSVTGGGEVLHIAPDGSPESLWSSREDAVYALSLANNGKLLLGTGNHGNVIELEGQRVFSISASAASDQVTAFAPGAGGTVYVATANPGKVFVLGPGQEKDGSYESEAFDAKIFSQWGKLTWWGENGATAGKVAFYVRSGNTSRPGENWSDWAGPYSNAGGETVSCPAARFVQWKVVFRETDGGGAPTISWVNLAYLPKNVAPVIDSIIVQSPGIRVQGFVSPVGGVGAPVPVQLRIPPGYNPTGPITPAPAELPKPVKVEIPPQGFEQKGYRSVLWSTHDENDDDLTFSVYIQGEGEKNWRLLKDKIEQHYYSWDATTLPDGAYFLKIVASDAPSNPADRALTAERVSDRFDVDNTPPTIEHVRAQAGSGGHGDATVVFDVRDPASTIERAEYSLDSSDWSVVFPKGSLSDSLQESYQMALHDLSAGEHTFSVRVSNRYDNTATAKITFDITR